MGAAEYQGVDGRPVGVLLAQLLPVVCGPFQHGLGIVAFNGVGQSVTGLAAHMQRMIGRGFHTTEELYEAGTLNGAARGKHANVSVSGQKSCWLERGLHADERQIGVGFSQIVDGEGRRCVAGHHQRLNGVLSAQLLGDPLCPCDHHLGGSLAIRRVGVVGQVNKMHLRQLGAQRAQHAEPAHAAVENANGGQVVKLRRQRAKCP